MAYSKFPASSEPTLPRRGLLNIPPPRQGGGKHNHYNPDEPRVPAGHPDSGQWTREGQSGAGLFPYGIPSNVWPPGAQLESPYRAEFFSDFVPDNAWIPGAQYVEGGSANRLQHLEGVDAAKQELLKLGYSIMFGREVAVDVPGFATPRFYDLIVRHPDTGQYIGVEVKTTMYDTVHLKADQLAKDAAVMTLGGQVRGSDMKIESVGYRTYCEKCDEADMRPTFLRKLLDAARIPYNHGKRPWQPRR